MFSGLGLLALICLCWLPFAMLLYPVLPRRWGRILGRRVIMRALRFYLSFLETFCSFRFDLSELDQLADAGPLVLVANHPSLLDAVMILSRLPDVTCIIKARLMNNLLFGSAARLARYISNASVMDMVIGARSELSQGAQLVIFPEGTRTTRFPLNDCYPSAALIAARSKTPIQALLIECSTPYLGKEWGLFRRPVLPLEFRVRLGQRFRPPAKPSAFTRELETYFRRELQPAMLEPED